MEQKEKKRQANKGITLIALVVTIVVLIILATVSINTVLGDNGIISRAQKARDSYSNSQKSEDEQMAVLANEMAQYDTKGGGSGGGSDTPTKPAEGITATVEGKTVTITKDNVATYLGKVVTNYVPTATTVAVGTNTYTVSNNYRLYYVDFDGKYGEKNGVYLKADCTNKNYSLPITDTTASTADNVKIKALNPSLYKDGATSPTASQENMKAVTFLTNTNNWNSLKTGASIADKVNYVVGAPSVEMMMDSYNTKYGLKDKAINIEELTADTERAKLVYQYTSGDLGYKVGPCHDNGTEYDYYTSDYSVKTDATIDSMYYPGNSQYYWLASPSAYTTNHVLYVYCLYGGRVNDYVYGGGIAFCPLVSLKSTVSLELQ